MPSRRRAHPGTGGDRGAPPERVLPRTGRRPDREEQRRRAGMIKVAGRVRHRSRQAVSRPRSWCGGQRGISAPMWGRAGATRQLGHGASPGISRRSRPPTPRTALAAGSPRTAAGKEITRAQTDTAATMARRCAQRACRYPRRLGADRHRRQGHRRDQLDPPQADPEGTTQVRRARDGRPGGGACPQAASGYLSRLLRI